MGLFDHVLGALRIRPLGPTNSEQTETYWQQW